MVQKRCNLTCLTNYPGVKQKKLPEMAADSLMVSEIDKNVNLEAHIKAKHEKKHSGEKPNKCNQCNYESSQARNLRSHLKIHSGEKTNKCNQCNYASSRTDHLRTHLKIHSGEKSNKCSLCDFACSDPSSLSSHVKRHSGEKPNKCSQCDYAAFVIIHPPTQAL